MRRAALAAISVTALALSACQSDSEPDAGPPDAPTMDTAPDGDRTSESTQEPESDATESQPTTEPSPPDDQADTGEQEDATRGTHADIGGPYGSLRDGVWTVGPAGEVEFAVTDGALELIDVRPFDGWDVTDQDIGPDEIEIDFRQGPVEYEIEIELQNGVLEIEIDQDIDPAEPGTFAIGEAATAEVFVEDGVLVLGEVVLNDGWTETDRDVSSDDIELDFRRDGDGFFETWELNADLDDGELEIEIDYEIEGVFTTSP